MRPSRLPLPKPAGSKLPPSPRRCLVKRPAAGPPIQIDVSPPQDSLTLTSNCTIRVSPKQTSNDKLSPLPPRSPRSNHRYSRSFDSGIGSSICGSTRSSSHGDAVDALSVPVVPSLPLLYSRCQSKTPPTTPLSPPHRSDMEGDNALRQSPALTHDYHESPESRVSTPPTSPVGINVTSPADDERVLANAYMAEEVAENVLALLGIPLHALEFKDNIVSLSASYLQKLIKIVKGDPFGGAGTVCQSPLGDDDGANTTSAPADPETSTGQQNRDGGWGQRGADSTRDASHAGSSQRQLRRNRDENEEDPDERRRKGKRRAWPPGGPRELPDTLRYSCPFRKLDPITFNVRDHAKCANNELEGMSNLKKHITYCHDLNGLPCRRCWEQFESPEDLHRHTRSPEPCPLRESPPTMAHPKDGISITTRDILGSRKDHEKVTTWDRLWIVLFGNNVPVKDHHFVPVVELEEVHMEFNAQLPLFVTALNAHHKELLGDLVYHKFKRGVDFITSFVQQWMRELLFEKCREIPNRSRSANIASVSLFQVEVTQTPSLDFSFSGSEVSMPVTYETCGSAADGNSGQWTASHCLEISPFLNQVDLFGDGTTSHIIEDEYHLDSGPTTMAAPQPEAFPAQVLSRQRLALEEPQYQPVTTVGAAATGFNPASLGPPALPTPTATPPGFADQAHSIMVSQPPFGDPMALRAVQMSDRHRKARLYQQYQVPHHQVQQQQQQQQQGPPPPRSQQHLYQPRIPMPVQRFHERESGPITRPGCPVPPTTNTALRDSGVSDVGSSYSGQGGEVSGWKPQRAASPLTTLYISAGGSSLGEEDQVAGPF